MHDILSFEDFRTEILFKKLYFKEIFKKTINNKFQNIIKQKFTSTLKTRFLME